MLIFILKFICWLPIIGGSLYSLLTVWTTRRFLRNLSSDLHHSQPPVSVLKPVCGLEKDLKEHLRSICLQDYPEYQVIYSVQNPQDPAFSILKEIQEEFGSDRVSVVISTVEAGANGKVNNLLGALPEARHEIIIISDSDTNLRPDYLKTITAPFADQKVGCVCTLFKLIKANSWYEQMELLTINADFIPSVMFAQVTGSANACLGPSMAIRKTTLQQIGGLDSFADYLVEDYEIGRRVWTSGKKMLVLPYIIDAVVDIENWGKWWRHQVYWDQNTYLAQPIPFITTVFIRSIPFALFLVILSKANLFSLGVLASVIIIRVLTSILNLQAMNDSEGIKSIVLLPWRDTIGLVFWVLAFTQRTVVWRGVEFKLTRYGKMEVVNR